MKFFNFVILIPFLGTIAMTLWYLQQGGICYDAQIDRFWYKGCEVCATGLPPINGTSCPTTFLVNGRNVTTYDDFYLWELNRTDLCTDEVKFCFYEF